MEENGAKKGDGMNGGHNFKYQGQRRLTEKTKSKWEKSQENNWGMPSRQRNSKRKGPEVAVPSVKEEKQGPSEPGLSLSSIPASRGVCHSIPPSSHFPVLPEQAARSATSRQGRVTS